MVAWMDFAWSINVCFCRFNWDVPKASAEEKENDRIRN